MNMLCPLLEGRKSVEFLDINDKKIAVHPNFRFFATQNAFYSDRHELPISLRNRFLEVQFNDFEQTELVSIIINKKDTQTIDEATAQNIASVYRKLRENNIQITMREIIKWIRRQATFPTSSYHFIGLQLISGRYSKQDKVSLVKKLIYDEWKINEPLTRKLHIEQLDDATVLLEEESMRVVLEDNCRLDRSFLFANGRMPPKSFVRALVRLSIAVRSNEPVLLIGPSAYKSLLVQTWTRIHGLGLLKVHLTCDTESANLVGQIQPYNFLEMLKLVKTTAEQLVCKIESLIREQHLRLSSEADECLRELRKILGKEKCAHNWQELIDNFKLLNEEEEYKSNAKKSTTIYTDQVNANIGYGDGDEEEQYDFSPGNLYCGIKYITKMVSKVIIYK